MNDITPTTQTEVQTLIARLPNAELITVAELATALDIQTNTIYAWIDSGFLKVIDLSAGKNRSYYKVFRAQVINFLRSRIK